MGYPASAHSREAHGATQGARTPLDLVCIHVCSLYEAPGLCNPGSFHPGLHERDDLCFTLPTEHEEAHGLTPTRDRSETLKPLHLTTADLAVRWGMHIGTLANWRCSGTGPNFLRIAGGRVLYRLADVEAYEDGCYVIAGEAA